MSELVEIVNICQTFVTCYGKRDHIPHFVKIEIISQRDRALKADYKGTFSLAMRCSVVML